MTTIEAILAALGISLKALIGSAVGGLLSLNFFDGLNPTRRWIVAAGGLAIGALGTGPLVAYFRMTPLIYDGAVGLVLGLFGMSVVSAVLKTVRDTDWAGIVRSRLGRGGDA
jgi:mannose/fructose/N-acetylgalactosamine-specific phosphotransferase system component IID